MRGRLDLRLAPGNQAPREARRALHSLAGELAPALLEDLCLLVSELVTNSVMHADGAEGPIRVQVGVLPHVVRIEVTDGGPGFEAAPAPARRREASGGGFGLHLVDRLASRWGVDRSDRARAWVELDRGAESRGRPASGGPQPEGSPAKGSRFRSAAEAN